jgi:hypothetical protein
MPRGARLQPLGALIDFIGMLAVGTVLGAITGGLIGLATETGVLRGTGVGGITGALVSMEVVESYLDIWRSGEPAIWSVVYVVGAFSARQRARCVDWFPIQGRKFAGAAFACRAVLTHVSGLLSST